MTSPRKRVVVEAPASSANLGPGFDVFALALAEPRDRVEATLEPANRFTLRITVDKTGSIPTSPHENSAGAVALSIARRHRLRGKVGLGIHKGVPIGVGLGSSGASSAGAAVAINALFDLGLGLGDLIVHSGAGEKAASGAAHLDNVTASLAGGFVIVPWRPNGEPIRFEPPKSMSVVIATPQVNLPRRKTAYARSLLPRNVGLSDLSNNVARASLMVAGFASGKIQWIGEGMADAVVEIARKRMIPGYDRVRAAALKEGASGVCISGAGPSMLAIVNDTEADPGDVLSSMIREFKTGGLTATGFRTTVGSGASVIESD